MATVSLGLGASVGARLKERGETVAVGESSCGGLVSAELVAVPGASAFYIGGATFYTREGFNALLEGGRDRFKDMRSATEPFTLALARAVREKFAVTWAIAETGASGPTGNPYGDPPGHACVAVSGPVELGRTVETGNDDREANMARFAEAALTLFEEALKKA